MKVMDNVFRFIVFSLLCFTYFAFQVFFYSLSLFLWFPLRKKAFSPYNSHLEAHCITINDINSIASDHEGEIDKVP